MRGGFWSEKTWAAYSGIALFQFSRAEVSELDRAALTVVLDAKSALERLLVLNLGNEFAVEIGTDTWAFGFHSEMVLGLGLEQILGGLFVCGGLLWALGE